jgi:hypothetical protein
MSRLHFKSALAGALVGGLLAAGLAPVAATVGDALIIGQSNTAHAQTELRGNVSTQNLKVFNSNPDGTGLNIQVKPHNPPFIVNTSFKVKRLNADYVDGHSASDFVGSTIVTRWSEVTVADGADNSVQVGCLAGEKIISGGAALGLFVADVSILSSRPSTSIGDIPANGSTFTHWRASADNPVGGTGSIALRAFAVCASN